VYSFAIGYDFIEMSFNGFLVLPGFPWDISLNQILMASTRALQIWGFRNGQAMWHVDLQGRWMLLHRMAFVFRALRHTEVAATNRKSPAIPGRTGMLPAVVTILAAMVQ